MVVFCSQHPDTTPMPSTNVLMLIELVIIPTFLTGVAVGVFAAVGYFRNRGIRDLLKSFLPQPPVNL